jgi:hypothetical protein
LDARDRHALGPHTFPADLVSTRRFDVGDAVLACGWHDAKLLN